ncbi:hypothetical protein DFH09DRAFT_1414228 [Mycena vulgaris]|nr:hypothetical protein DFH09DRAFT_1414228 [Mycena vulgaris]
MVPVRGLARLSCLPTWRPSTQFHLFRDVKICPDLDHYRGYRTIPAPSQSVTVPRCAKFCAALRNLLHAWSDVRTDDLEIITLFYSEDYLNQSGEIRPIYFQELHALLALPSLTRIEFPADHVLIVPRVVCSAPSLKVLVLENVLMMEEDLPPESRRRPRIESLKLWNYMVIMVEPDWLFPATNAAVDLSHLRHLDLWKVPRYMWNFIQSVSSTLEHLALDRTLILIHNYRELKSTSVTLPGVDLAIFPNLPPRVASVRRYLRHAAHPRCIGHPRADQSRTDDHPDDHLLDHCVHGLARPPRFRGTDRGACAPSPAARGGADLACGAGGGGYVPREEGGFPALDGRWAFDY